MSHNHVEDLTIKTTVESEEDGYVATISIFGYDVLTANGDTPGRAERFAKQRFVQGLSRMLVVYGDPRPINERVRSIIKALEDEDDAAPVTEPS